MLTSRIASTVPSWVEEHVPSSLHGRAAGLEAWQWAGLLFGVVVAYAVGRSLTYVLIRAASRITRRTKIAWDDSLLDALRPPSRFFFGLLTFDAVASALALPAKVAPTVGRVMATVLVGAVAWTLIRLVSVFANYVELRAVAAKDAGMEAELQARGLKTHVRVLRRVVSFCIGLVGLALMLTQFEVVRNVGVSLLASAGLAGVVLGFAAQRTFGSLIAGIQLSATQPIRLGDVVIIEKEWGTIEEITLTYVVVKIWDERRLVVPVTRFLDHPFENWTKVSASLHGTVMLYVDWALPVDELRKELDRIVEGHPMWDGRTKSVQVTQAKEQTIEVRMLVSAADPDKMWDLRVDVRERLVRWLQTYEGGRFLPRMRLEAGAPGRAA
jgi:small-conductance mechanosensitive channel